MDGDSTISCKDGGIWSSQIVCIIKDCGPIDKPDNGGMVDSSGTVFNSTLTFSCDDDYLLVGESTLLCQSDGKWSRDAPSCARLGDIGESCVTDKYCKTEGAVCRESKCICKTGVHDSRTDKCDTMPLYPYGKNESDILLTDWKQCANKIQFTPGLPFFGSVYTRIFVCPHGVVSLGNRYNNPTPPKNKNKVNKFTRDMIAPFHAHFKTGNVYYRSYDVLNSYETMAERAEIRHIEERVRQFGGVTSFEASFILIVTWENVLPEDIDFDTSESEASTIQLVLVSNGEMTYCFYIYPNGLVKWISNRREYAPVWVGYFSKMDTPFTHHNSFTPAALSLDKNVMHRGVSGVVFKTFVRVGKSVKNNNISCIKWYQENKHEKQHIDLMNSWLPQCPCDISLARWDPWFWHIDRWNWRDKKNFTCVDMLPGRIYRPYGKSCCYDYRTSLWVDERPIAGGFYRYHPEHAADHYKHDILPKEVCCSPFTPFSKFFYDLRPTGSCYRESPYNFGSFWGDPHFRTLDGLNFTFNGLGEYTLLQIQTENNTFTLQARTERAIKEDGNLSDATVFSAFAAKDETNASVHVELNRAKKGFNIYGNGLDLTQKYKQKTENDVSILPIPGGTLIVSKRGETLVVLFPSSEISLNISITVEMLSLSTIVPKKFHNVTSGLLGNYNGNPEDDFTLPTGKLLPSNLTERDVFSYGQNWEIDGDSSAFNYPDGKNHSDYHNSTYVPHFLDEVHQDKISVAEKACNGSDNKECVFDYVFTEKTEIALATNSLKENAERTKNEMGEVVPSLVGCESVNSRVEQKVSCPLKIESGSNISFLSNNVNATFDEKMGSINYFQADDEPVDLRVVAINQNGRSSPAFIVSVLLCTGCNDHGTCTDTQRDDSRNTEYFKYATCECYPVYDGPDCEHLFDGCADDPCSLERKCTSLNAAEQKKLNRTYLCDACPDGFMSNDTYNDSCLDVDECESSRPCDHNCTNTEGNYECTCMDGYRVDTRDKIKCTDINECEDLNTPHNCSQNCTNIKGSFMCSCYNGYEFVSGNCTPDYTKDNPCSNINCTQTAGCMIKDKNHPVCFCDNGYELSGKNSCKDIDECSRKACPQDCSNFNGGFNCSCFTGYKLLGATTCTKCEVGTWGENCQNECQCTGEGVKSCDSVKGCICEDGWMGDTCDKDINECNATIDVCDDPRKVCHDFPGSFKCQCLDGFKETLDGECEDVDECSVPSLNDCDQICKNNLGSLYSCECETGYTSLNSTCDNIDECVLKTHDCEQVCDDNPGSYNCYCYFGYTLNDDRKTCTKLSDPCLTLYGLNCSHYCFISTDHAECRCQDGYVLGSDNKTCIDVNECTKGLHTCDAKAECKNVDGSYTCECPIGSKLENDGRSCSDCDEFHYGKKCAKNCSCLHGYCNRIQGCVCNSGWRGNNCDQDFNECEAGEVICSMPNEECINTRGSAACDCLNGYMKSSTGHCVDVDECSDGKLNTCEQKCVNIPGGYNCECQKGFLLTGEKCQDIDECENKKSDCKHICENTLGSYRCYCDDGFKLNQTDRVSCTPAYGCSNSSACGHNSICFKSNGIDSCRCVNGFKNYSGRCEDIDECKFSSKPCSQNCINNEGSYFCTCNIGYYLTTDLTTCKECETGTYGVNCTQNCAMSCNVQNSETCDHINGSCTCKTGWKGNKCDTDIDECNNTTLCPKHSKCNNTDGGYDCICDVGYFKTSSESCLVCDDTHYGKNCAQKCGCERSNTASCNHTNGHCECNTGWTGENCSVNVDECNKFSDICKENSNCKDTSGSYKCICNDGFYENGDKCTDIDECSSGQNDCEHVCENTLGNYTCKCNKGHHGYWNDCKACSNNTFGENCSETCACYPANTNMREQGLCDSINGSCSCLTNWKGDTCAEDVDECEDGSICDSMSNAGCFNIPGWFSCDCYRGFKKVAGECVPDEKTTTTPLPVAAVSFNFNLSITNITLADSVDLNVSTTYNKYKDLAMESLRNYYHKFTTADFEIRITDLRKGSLIIVFVIQYKDDDAEVASALVNATKMLDVNQQFELDGKTYSAAITSDSFDVTDGVCNILQSTGTCNLEDCVEENGVAKCKSKEPLLSVPAMIGIGVGGGVVVLVIAFVTAVCLRRKRNANKRTAMQSANGRSLPDVPNKKADICTIQKWQDIATGSVDPRYLTWKSMLTNTNPNENTKTMYEELYTIPRAHIRRTDRSRAKDNTYF